MKTVNVIIFEAIFWRKKLLKKKSCKNTYQHNQDTVSELIYKLQSETTLVKEHWL